MNEPQHDFFLYFLFTICVVLIFFGVLILAVSGGDPKVKINSVKERKPDIVCYEAIGGMSCYKNKEPK